MTHTILRACRHAAWHRHLRESLRKRKYNNLCRRVLKHRGYEMLPDFNFEKKWRWTNMTKSPIEQARECEGNCQNHHGDIQRVRVTDKNGIDLGAWNYCQSAINACLKQNFKVSRLSR